MPSITIERAAGHISLGWRRRADVLAIHSMSPWRPALRNSASRWPLLVSRAAGVVMRATSNPAARASARMRSLRLLIVAFADRARPIIARCEPATRIARAWARAWDRAWAR